MRGWVMSGGMELENGRALSSAGVWILVGFYAQRVICAGLRGADGVLDVLRGNKSAVIRRLMGSGSLNGLWVASWKCN